MDYEKLNPCSYERIVWLLSWAETACWCCTSIRALLVGLWLGWVMSFLVFGGWRLALFSFVIGGLLVSVLLYVAREIWHESYEDEEPTQ